MRGVSTNPGHMALTVTPLLAFSRAAALVKPTIPCFAATQADLLTDATKPCTLATLMILPHPLCFICGKAYLVPQKAELRLSEMTFSQMSSGNSSTVLMCCMPALLTKISTFPKWAIDCSMRFLVSLGLVRSAKMNLADEVWLVSSFSRARISASGAKPLSTMLAPAAERERATPRPMPEREPVTTAVLPFKKVPNMTSINKYLTRYETTNQQESNKTVQKNIDLLYESSEYIIFHVYLRMVNVVQQEQNKWHLKTLGN